ncbi:MAG: hypothetical protein GY860_11535 [Desulfobacteraceae bacterium]|nr:hypothetical protein [Desulfobacteraceae bacterium]
MFNDGIRNLTGNDSLFGGENSDDSSSDGNDKLFGNCGNDMLNGGALSDTLTGCHGNDTFVFFVPQTPMGMKSMMTGSRIF